MVIAECPVCENNIEFNRQPQLKQRIFCPACRAELQIILTTPEVELDIIEWDDDITWNSKWTRWSKGSRRPKSEPFSPEDDKDELGDRPYCKSKKRSKRPRRKYQKPHEDYDL